MQYNLSEKICNADLLIQIKKKFDNSVSTSKIVPFSILYLSFYSPVIAQNYSWDWALSGGGVQGTENIYDVKVGSDNNYYFIGSMYGTIGTQLAAVAINTNNSSLGGNDIFLFSTTCDGKVRWSQAIGGSSGDFAYNLELDSDNNVYIGAHVNAVSSTVFFSHDPDPNHSIAPLPNQQAYNRIYLVKYNSDGKYQGRKALQGSIASVIDSEAKISDIVMKNDTLHFMVGLVKGTHLDGNVTVPAQYDYNSANMTYSRQFCLVKYDTDLNYISSTVLPISTDSFFPPGKPTRFAYNEILNHYYIANSREEGSNLAPFTYDSKTVVNRSYIIAFNGADGSLEWLREIYSNANGGNISPNRINSIKVDANSDVYIGGCVRKNPNETNLKIYDPTDASVQPYFFTPGADYGTLPILIKFNSTGNVQWLKTTKTYNSNALVPGPRYGEGITIRGNEVVLGAQGANEFWDNFQIQRPVSHQPDPVLIRFNKQTGSVIGIHEIEGSLTENQRLTVVTVDNDGNYVTGGVFTGSLFTNNGSSMSVLNSVGDADFFVSKLAAGLCGTSVSTDKVNKLKVNVYPNPTNDIVNIETQEILYIYEVYNIVGKLIQKGIFYANNQISLSGVVTGTYFIKVTTTQGRTATVKVMKK